MDENLRLLGISRLSVEGYSNAVNSHTAVATYVARGLADVGIGNQKAAMQVEGIDFIPLREERLELVVNEEYLNKTGGQLLLNAVSSQAFRDEVAGRIWP